MTLARAIDVFLEQMQLERDWTPRTVASYFECLAKLTSWLIARGMTEPMLSDLDGRAGTDLLRRFLGDVYGRTSSATRSTRISYLHSFFAWAEDEQRIADDPARRIKRPPKRKPDVYRPTADEVARLLRSAQLRELAPLLLMAAAGLRASEVCSLLWSDLDLARGRVRVKRKGGNWQHLPLDPSLTEALREVYLLLEPEHDDHVFTAETELWLDQEHRIRRTIDPKTPRQPKSLWALVQRVAKRAGVRPVGPHALRHGYANTFLQETRERFGVADTSTLQLLMGHSRIDTTQQYLRELEAEDAENVLRRLRGGEVSQTEGLGDTEALVTSDGQVEAAGIEPASPPVSPGRAGGIEPEPPSGPAQASPGPKTERSLDDGGL